MEMMEKIFWRNVNKKGPEDCWEWRGSKKSNGYGKLLIEGNHFQAHRVSWKLHFGVIPEGMLVLHKCDNRICVNPNHLEIGTQSKNITDAIKRKRVFPPVFRGEKHPRAKLTTEEVKQIRSSKGKTQRELAKMYGVSRHHINKIVNNKMWKEE